MEETESFERALADVEIVVAAYPDEVSVPPDDTGGVASNTSFPLRWTIHFSEHTFVTLELVSGYPIESGVQVSSYRSSPNDKDRIEATVSAIRVASRECQRDEIEGGFACCSMALETWNNYQESEAALITAAIPKSTHMTTPACNERLRMDRADTETCYKWISGKPLMDKKSTFQAHLCRVSTERDVYAALDQLIAGSSKLQRASHNMLAWRISEAQADGTTVLKHDNSDDGEAQSGSKLAYLLGKTRSMFARIFDALDKKISFLLPLFK